MYNQYPWTNGEVVNADKLNHIESGIYTNSAAIPASTTVSAGVITIKNEAGTALFTITLPLYNGGVE